ncbi:DUF4126 family protein [Granulicella sp. S190]|uniref:DUF4126 family protein n=1 Tax=Granulicella sp. S190 TaxID=1747226 RepID=UPI00131D829D|nr:DUF4126 family protein [Granulicella sp. S190]
MIVILPAFLLGVVCGLRAITAPAAVSWAARLGLLQLQGTPLAFLGYAATPYILTLFAVGELINDKLPKTPSRKTPPQFITRVVTGLLVGAAIGAAHQYLVLGLIGGAIGAVLGTFGGSALRAKLSESIGRDLPGALLEDAAAIILAVIVVIKLR